MKRILIVLILLFTFSTCYAGNYKWGEGQEGGSVPLGRAPTNAESFFVPFLKSLKEKQQYDYMMQQQKQYQQQMEQEELRRKANARAASAPIYTIGRIFNVEKQHVGNLDNLGNVFDLQGIHRWRIVVNKNRTGIIYNIDNSPAGRVTQRGEMFGTNEQLLGYIQGK